MIPARRKAVRLALAAAVTMAAGYAALCGFFFAVQDGLIFLGQPLDEHHVFEFPWVFEEHRVPVEGGSLHALLFRASSPSRGVVYYLHGNAGNLQGHGFAAGPFLERGYDFFAIDYRGYGKSGGRVDGEAQLRDDVERAYAWLRTRYDEPRIVVVGYSLGTAPAAFVASRRRPRALVLIAPFFSLLDLAGRLYPILPSALLNYPLRTDEWVRQVQAPITILHGTADTVIPISDSERLAGLLPPTRARFVRLEGAGHEDWDNHPSYLAALRHILP